MKCFKFKHDLESHMKTKHVKPSYFCGEKCLNLYKNFKDLEKHDAIIHVGFNDSCKQCDNKALEANLLKKHIISVHQANLINMKIIKSDKRKLDKRRKQWKKRRK